jgi:hypothetical protein
MKTKFLAIGLLGLLLLARPALVQAQFSYTTNPDGITINITGYSGTPAVGPVDIPTKINDLTVVSIGDGAFAGSILNYPLLVIVPDNCPTSVTIPGSVASIGEEAFWDCDRLTNVTISGSVTGIGEEAFADCASLTAITVDASNSVYSSLNGVLFDKGQFTLLECPGGLVGSYTIPGSVTNIADWAFYSCTSLSNVTIPGSVTSIGEEAFYYCTNLRSVTIPGSVNNTRDYAFVACTGLTNATMANGVTSIGDYEFSACSSLATITIPGTVTNMGDGAFNGCGNLTSVTIPGGVTSIGVSEFSECWSLTNVTIPRSVTSIGAQAFLHCITLTSVTIPASVTNFDNMAFYACYDLKSVYFQGNAPVVGSLEFSYDTDVTVYYLPGTSGWSEFSAETGVPVVLWNPLIQSSGVNFGISNNNFGFNITGTANIPIVVEASTDLANSVWTPLRTLTLTNGSVYFSEPLQTNSSGRFFRISSPSDPL